jgi:EAL domain-containing protein (putative c-di-GMP-specific phosphodiesterase class I)
MSEFKSDDMSVEPMPRIAIAEALRNDWFEIWYQPKVDLKRKCLAGAEALARVHHPEHGVLLPGGFVAEVDGNDIAELAGHTLMSALSDWTMFEDAGFTLHLAVNLPVRVLLEQPIAQLVGEHRPKSSRWPGLLVEVTEDELVRDIARANAIAGQIQSSGIALVIDDFGVGHPWFSDFRELPIAELKIAGRHVKDCATDETSRTVCQAAVELAHRVGCVAVADGVASPVDLQAVMAMGCDYAQGPLIAPFLPKQDFLDLLRQRNAPRPSTPKDIAGAAAIPIGRVA